MVLLVALAGELFATTIAFAQDDVKIRNVRFSQVNRTIVVLYDLMGSGDDRFNVDLVLKRENMASYRYIPSYVSGDVGLEVVPGRDRKVVWEIDKEFPDGLEGDDFYFDVDAAQVSSGVSWLVWLGGAGLLGAGAAVFLLGGSSDEVAPTPSGYPHPPGRP